MRCFSKDLIPFTHLDGLLCHGLAVDPPLGLHDRLDDVAGFAAWSETKIKPRAYGGNHDSPADWDLHGVVLGLDVQTLLLERFKDLGSNVESFHALM